MLLIGAQKGEIEMVNSVVLVGRLTADPELRYTPAGTALAEFSLAVKRNGRSDGGEDEVDFIPIVAWRQNAEFASQYLTKGRLVAVEGSIRVNHWKDKEEKNRTSTEIVAERLKPLDKPAQESVPEPAVTG